MEGRYHLRRLPDHILRQSCVEVNDFSDLGDLLSNMREIIEANKGVGLAAPQIGDNRRVAIAKIGEEVREFINPKKLREGKHPYSGPEGCLSVPGEIVQMNRRYPIQVGYQDRQGMYHTEVLRGLNAVVLQHEMDHLDGILIIDNDKPTY